MVNDHRYRRSCCLGIRLHEDADLDPTKEMPHTYLLGDTEIDSDNLNQEFRLEDAMFMVMLSCDLVQTKNLATKRATIAGRLGISVDCNGTLTTPGS